MQPELAALPAGLDRHIVRQLTTTLSDQRLRPRHIADIQETVTRLALLDTGLPDAACEKLRGPTLMVVGKSLWRRTYCGDSIGSAFWLNPPVKARTGQTRQTALCGSLGTCACDESGLWNGTLERTVHRAIVRRSVNTRPNSAEKGNMYTVTIGEDGTFSADGEVITAETRVTAANGNVYAAVLSPEGVPVSVSLPAFEVQPSGLRLEPLMGLNFVVNSRLGRHRMPRIRFLFIGSRHCSKLPSDPLRDDALALCLDFTSIRLPKGLPPMLPNMLGTPRKKGSRKRLPLHDTWRAYPPFGSLL